MPNICAKMDIGKRGWRLAFKGKHKNKAACAGGGKLLTYNRHIVRGDPSPNRESGAFFKRKMVMFYGEPGVHRMRELGCASRNEFAEKMTRDLYGRLPPTQNRQG